MGTAAQIRSYRVRVGKSAAEVARHLGLNDAWYHDLEHNDDELASTLTLFQAIELASILGVRLRDLVSNAALPDEHIPLAELPSRIKAHVARTGISIEQFEDEVGWEVHEFLQSPLKVAAESPIVFLQAVAEHLAIDWLSLVPDETDFQAR
jgi:transcriptional regulator with XRE-family HTH domain